LPEEGKDLGDEKVKRRKNAEIVLYLPAHGPPVNMNLKNGTPPSPCKLRSASVSLPGDTIVACFTILLVIEFQGDRVANEAPPNAALL
jgi:hypothetical protein